jgi:hypothetical protein
MESELRTEVAGLLSDMRGMEQRLGACLDACSEKLIKRLRTMLIGWTIINTTTFAGALYGLAQWLGH